MDNSKKNKYYLSPVSEKAEEANLDHEDLWEDWEDWENPEQSSTNQGTNYTVDISSKLVASTSSGQEMCVGGNWRQRSGLNKTCVRYFNHRLAANGSLVPITKPSEVDYEQKHSVITTVTVGGRDNDLDKSNPNNDLSGTPLEENSKKCVRRSYPSWLQDLVETEDDSSADSHEYIDAFALPESDSSYESRTQETSK